MSPRSLTPSSKSTPTPPTSSCRWSTTSCVSWRPKSWLRGRGERRARLDRECGDNAALRQRLDVLLQAFDDAGSLLEDPPLAPEPNAQEPGQGASSSPATPGTVIGPYKLLQEIGEGGMGTVFMAEQTQPVQRMVALKIIKPGMDSRQVIARFEAERRALAIMDHPNIAKVLDAGVGPVCRTGPEDSPAEASGPARQAGPTGPPYFVMELVKGVPITNYCDEHRLTLKERLALFIPVCQAVMHAHQKGIIHRDLKPSNVLVARYDEKPVPKVIDFGVAKATGQKLTERTLFTHFGQLIGTLEYMSPEQAALNALDVDTRSDIYSLGVLLYELLAGSTPFELAWIVMKALDKNRNRRYQTASGFAEDIERCLNNEPVLARATISVLAWVAGKRALSRARASPSGPSSCGLPGN